MSGVKGRSGRRAQFYDVRINELAGLSVKWAIENWDILTQEQKLKLVMTIGPKYVQQNFNFTGDLTVEIFTDLIQKARQRIETINRIENATAVN